MPEDDPATLACLLTYLYILNYCDTENIVLLAGTSKTALAIEDTYKVSDSALKDDHELAVMYNNLWVYIAAEKYEVPGLHDEATK